MAATLDIEEVARTIREVEAAQVAPWFRALSSGDVFEKSPGEVVTVADRACEAELGPRLRSIVDATVVGEEAAASAPSILERIADEPVAWVVDPIDGTTNFAAGSTEYAVMVALVEQGDTVAGWIWRPGTDEMRVAEKGSGAYCNGDRVRMGPAKQPADATGVVKDRFLPTAVAEVVSGNERRFLGFEPGWGCAGVEYPAVADGTVDFLWYWRTLPWDHAPGVLFIEEAGGAAQRPDGRRYRCGDTEDGLVVAHADVVDDVRRALLSPRPGRRT